ncbi:hypothetical protein IAG41_00255 [Sphingomonas sp. JC676]|uniref:hypothetical protein n=1 Tax=Sphingomonas sp. JC676 TaxID=2768065 RepID=UPI001657D996|nr:hypothetical protein [Sphingomonas sp. JC676]MBC9030812.1 hypothetical protein [Sphingomonas sp. JC676]
MKRVAKGWKASALTAGLLGLAVLSGVGLANYADSGAFSFYKQQKRPERSADLHSEAATTPVAVYSSTSASGYSVWMAPPPAPIEDASISNGVIEGVDANLPEDGLDQNLVIQPIATEARTEALEPTLSQTRVETPSSPNAFDTGQGPTSALPVDGSEFVPSTGDEPTRPGEPLN